jgi:4,5-DOPA dioxygenase extradiol
MPFAHPTADHFIPLFVTLGAATDAARPVDTAIDGYMMGFSKRSFQTIG